MSMCAAGARASLSGDGWAQIVAGRVGGQCAMRRRAWKHDASDKGADVTLLELSGHIMAVADIVMMRIVSVGIGGYLIMVALGMQPCRCLGNFAKTHGLGTMRHRSRQQTGNQAKAKNESEQRAHAARLAEERRSTKL